MDASTHEDGYTGTVTVTVGGGTITAQATLRGYFEPVDGRYHWYGRIAADAALTELVGAGKSAARITTDHGAADGVLSDLDTWGRLRISGISTPPFPIVQTLDDLDRTTSTPA